MSNPVDRAALTGGAVCLLFALVLAGCSGGGSSTPTASPSSSPTTAPAGSASNSYTASSGSGPFALPNAGGFSGTVNETVVSAGASHSSVPLNFTAFAGPPALPSGVTLSTNGLNIYYSFAQTFAQGTTGDSVTLNGALSTSLTLPATFSTANQAFFSQVCYYTPSAASGNQFVCDASSVATPVNGTLVSDTNNGMYAATNATIPYGTTVYVLFFTVAASGGTPAPSSTATATPVVTSQATTVPLTVGAANFTIPAIGGYSGTLQESVTAITALDNPTSSSMLLTATNGVPSPLPSGASITPQNATVFYTLSQQVAPGALPGSTLSGTVTFASPFYLALTTPPNSASAVYSQLCYYYGGANPSFSCDPSAVAVKSFTNTSIIDTNIGTTNQYWMLANGANNTPTAAQTYYLVVYKLFYVPTGSATPKSAIRVTRSP